MHSRSYSASLRVRKLALLRNIRNKTIIIYVNKIGIRSTFKTKTGYYLELITPEIMKLLGSIKAR